MYVLLYYKLSDFDWLVNVVFVMYIFKIKFIFRCTLIQFYKCSELKT